MKREVPEILPQLLIRTAEKHPDHGIGFVQPDHTVHFSNFPVILDRSLSILAGMQAAGLRKGDKVVLLLEKSEEIIPVLWGCFLGGIIPALLQPPVSFSEYNPALDKAGRVFRLLGSPPVILSHSRIKNWKPGHIPAGLLMDAAGLSGDPRMASPAELNGADVALIQFSSGSTGDPKGVLLSHRNIIANTTDIIRGIALEPEDVSVNWMPLYHDMGLIGFHITPVFAGVTQYFLDPVDFVKNPALWLETMTRKKCTITACPNFGQLLVNRFLARRKARDWDLSPVRILFNGAEPISVATMRAFLESLKPFRLDPVAMFPAYGLAEATLAVTFPDRFSEAGVVGFRRGDLLTNGVARETLPGEENVMELVNLGRPLNQCRVLITDGKDQPVEEGTVGNVLVKGNNITRGYFGKKHSSSVFYREWLRTGDLGFRYKEDLYITGRSKDIIFVNGINYYAHDLESIAIQMDEVSPGRIVVSGFFDEKEGHDRLLVFLVGSDNDAMRELCRKLKTHFSSLVGLSVETFIPVRSNDIPRTSSGKIQRYKMVERFVKGEFPGSIRL